ncbi:MAG: hypothetical protein OEX12_13385 [Gammaproteobacteria bacterium]|nr:hypothetical protein [Gammaproteobacteria bacterium]
MTKIRELPKSLADTRSAELLFNAIADFYDMSQATVLDMFARDGAITIRSYQDKVRNVHAWELDGKHERILSNINNVSEVVVGCSYTHLQRSKGTLQGHYDMVVLDTPLGLHRDEEGNTRCEHFDALRGVIDSGILKDKSLIVMYCNRNPYNRDEIGSHGYDEYEDYNFDEWMALRATFYKVSGPLTEEQMISAYRSVALQYGYQLSGVIATPCHSDIQGSPPYAFRLCLELTKD